MKVLVDVVEHQAGGADPALARQLIDLNQSSEGGSGLLIKVGKKLGTL